MFCSSQNFLFKATDFLSYEQLQMVQSKNTYHQSADPRTPCYFTKACCTWGDFSTPVDQAGHTLRQLLSVPSYSITATPWEQGVFLMLISVPEMTTAIQWVCFHKWYIQQKCTWVNFFNLPIPMWLHFVETKFCRLRRILQQEDEL
jgi:hypothetical protein